MAGDAVSSSSDVGPPARLAADSFLRSSVGIHRDSWKSDHAIGAAAGLVANDAGDRGIAGCSGILEGAGKTLPASGGDLFWNWRCGFAALAHVLRGDQIVERVRWCNVYG